jgi:hypothetical protein
VVAPFESRRGTQAKTRPVRRSDEGLGAVCCPVRLNSRMFHLCLSAVSSRNTPSSFPLVENTMTSFCNTIWHHEAMETGCLATHVLPSGVFRAAMPALRIVQFATLKPWEAGTEDGITTMSLSLRTTRVLQSRTYPHPKARTGPPMATCTANDTGELRAWIATEMLPSYAMIASY